MNFLDRTDAGRQLAARLRSYASRSDVVVFGLARGGVPVAFEIAGELRVPLDVFVVRKLGVPHQEELAFGAIASGGVRVLDAEVIEAVGISEKQIEQTIAREQEELMRREQLYRSGRAPLNPESKAVILVDDGIATGASTAAAILALRAHQPAKIILAVPVAPAATYRKLRFKVDEFVCLHAPEFFYAIGQFYEDFSQVSDQRVMDLLRLNRERLEYTVASAAQGARTGE